ncbi:UDP:flavonoid glycosyltransferase YjiC, YdhE family [Blastococcus aurantiacus]|uniref:UDP:flavonoid glycosyltransferase YjiC, YdhE family n=1 Tax=Blastococcus aurantiacus TaxID=1550231 RepID=A0A1G7JC25_9ACTN|nr:nucleotide disphospho-sugar-binding domain-containing protein [Blastococcus aurantiacus]SDF22324.1 UDP:flavonoid glycosyltransferase YjiC, YdhE family [Blastococcus aurantiacus]
MRLALVTCGTRGDTQPMLVLALELQRRGHEVVLGVSPNLVGWCLAAGVTALPFGPDSQAFMTSARGQEWLAAGNVRAFMAALSAESTQHAPESRAQLRAVTAGADLVVAGVLAEDVALAAAEAAGVLLVTLHSFPVRRTSAYPAALVTQRPLPAPVNRITHLLFEQVWWRGVRTEVADCRRDLGLPASRRSTARQLADRGSTEVQAYSRLLVPALDDYGPHRPLVGFLDPTPELRARVGETGIDPDLAGWLDEGPPPVFVGFGSMPVTDPAAALDRVRAVCTRLGLRALVGAGWSAFTGAGDDRVRVAGVLDHDAVLPRCAAAVHHGGAGTTSAVVSAGLPSLVCSVFADQPFWGARLQALGVGTHVRFADLDETALERGLRAALEPATVERAGRLGAALREERGAELRVADLLEATVERTPV